MGVDQHSCVVPGAGLLFFSLDLIRWMGGVSERDGDLLYEAAGGFKGPMAQLGVPPGAGPDQNAKLNLRFFNTWAAA